ncbi:MAG TPA: type 4a pilus biogenesis protein PilO [Actinomycetota bacterium]|nr:type 4a pilus biogenesis protein PilO [Actinomycetota bacterium]
MGSRRGPIFAAIGVVVVAILLLLFLVLPKMHSVSDAQGQLDQARQQQTTLEVRKAALEQAKLDAPKNQQIINNVHKRIPPTADEPGLIQLLNGAAVSAGIQLVSLTPSNPTFDSTTGLSTISVAVSATGSYFDITQFMYNIETLPRAAVVTTLTLAPVDATSVSPSLTMSATVNTFTSDTSAGPGSSPGPTAGTAGGTTTTTGTTGAVS